MCLAPLQPSTHTVVRLLFIKHQVDVSSQAPYLRLYLLLCQEDLCLQVMSVFCQGERVKPRPPQENPVKSKVLEGVWGMGVWLVRKPGGHGKVEPAGPCPYF